MALKTYLGLVALALLLSSSSCSKDKDADDIPTGLTGEWICQNVSCFCNFSPDEDFSDHRLQCASDQLRLTVTNREDGWFLAPSGEYGYAVANDIITINDREYQFSIKENQLALHYQDDPQIADDEVSYYYIKK